MLTRPIPATGEVLPILGLGTWQSFDVGSSPSARAPLQEVLRAFAEQGGTLVDSSPMYGKAEGVVGDLAQALGLGDRLFLATKVWTTGRAAGIRQMETSLRLLRAETIDLMQVHNLVDVATHLDTLRGWKRDGRVRYIGATHYTASAHDALAALVAAEPLDFIQVNYSVAEPEAERRLLPLARDRGVAVVINRPLGGGGLIRRLGGRPLPDWAVAAGYQNWSQLLLLWVISHPAVTCAIPATSSAAHLHDNLLAGDGPLPDDDMRARIAAAVTG
jgi:aryl-alcohol dehydrogenase-like predicted oxidoreductase